ncbi:MAG: type IV secretion protein IcmB [Alphaproteobacteria bacterium]|nr:type IV secretion protein IcmB [Alphaproteobacteria bacterium]
MDFVTKLLLPFRKAFKQSLSSFIQLETADDEVTLVSSDGSLISYIKIEGSRQIVGEEEFKHIVEASTIKIGARFDRQGHAMQVFFTRDPDRVRQQLNNLIRPSRTTARNTRLDIDDLFDQRVAHLEKFIRYEDAYFVLWTRPSVLSQNELKRAGKQARSKAQNWFNAFFAQHPMAALEPLRNHHKSFVTAILSALDEMGIKGDLLEVHNALSHVRACLFPDHANEHWRPCLPGDPIPPRAPMSRVDMSDILWPNLASQIVAGDARTVGRSLVRIGDLLWAGGDMTLGPMEATAFPVLMNRFVEADIPFRISFLIEGGGSHGTQFRGFVATILGPTNSVNRQIKYSLEGLQAMARSEPVVRIRVSVATWCKLEEKEKIHNRLAVLLQGIESWGYCQVTEFSGDPLECVMSSAMGLHCSGSGVPGIAPMAEIMKLLPWQRPSSPFSAGAMLFRTPDGKVWPYQTGTNLTTTWFDLIFAQPGAGKSVLLNSLNLATCLSPGMSKLPYVAVIDIGPSSSGLISLVREALPLHRQHEAAYYRLQMSHQYAINPFDTQLGCRYPLPDERSYLVELLTLLCTPPGFDKPYDGIQQLAGLVVDEMFRWRDDKSANAEARPYLARLESEVDEAIQKYNVHLPADPYWWDIVDKMFDLEQYHIANLAQRHAVPTLNDAITASRRPQIRTLLEETAVGFSTESVIGAFERMITSSIREFPILSSITQFDIADARVCSLDLMDVAPQGDETADRQTSIMYMLARHALVRSWWMSMDSIQHVPVKYREYHSLRLQEISETPKRLCYDEFHRTSRSFSVRAQVIRDVREGRKRGVQIVLSSQLLEDFSKDMVDLATGIWVCGSAISEQAVDQVQETFGLSKTARMVVRHKLTGPKAHGAPALLVLATTEGRYEQHLYNTMGPIELWALSTSSEDVAIRHRLYAKLGAGRARQMLAAAYPGGSARNEIRRRVIAKSEDGDARSALISEIIEEIVLELIEASRKEQKDEAERRVKALAE